MIIKRARGRESGVSSFSDLAKYIANESKTADVMLCSENLPDIESAAEIMQATAATTKSKDPLYHVILSVPEGESWTPDQARESVERLLAGLGMEDHQWIAAKHVDTDHHHLHVMISKVHPKTEEFVSPYRDFPILHKVAREIEISQNRAHDRGMFEVILDDDGEKQIVRAGLKFMMDISEKAREFELATGVKSFQRWARENDALQAALSRATSWHEFHLAADAFGLVVEKVDGDGGRRLSDGIRIFDRRDKNCIITGSRLGEEFALPALEKRLGAYQESPILSDFEVGEILEQLLVYSSTFSLVDISRWLESYVEADRRDAAMAEILAHPDLVHLAEEGAEDSFHFTLRGIRAAEEETMELARELNRAESDIVADRDAAARFVERLAENGIHLNDGQLAGLEAGLSSRRLVVVQGRAGTGKSTTMAGWVDAFRASGAEVVGLTKQNVLLASMAADGFGQDNVATLDRFLGQVRRGKISLDGKVLVIDEAGMVENEKIHELLKLAEKSDCLIRLVGDDLQLPAVGRAGIFSEMCHSLEGGAEIGQIMRQRTEEDLAVAELVKEGQFGKAIRVLDDHGRLHLSDRADDAVTALRDQYISDLEAAVTEGKTPSLQAFAYTNSDVDRLNAELRAAHKSLGLIGEEFESATHHGPTNFGVGDRIVITKTDRKAGFAAGDAGVVRAIDPTNFRIKVHFPTSGEAKWISLGKDEKKGQFGWVKHGYCSTIYKSQGQTVDRIYLLHSAHWKDAASYVALTRQRYAAHVFAGRDVAIDAYSIGNQMARSMGKFSAASDRFTEKSPDASIQRRVRQAVYGEEELGALHRGEGLPEKRKGKDRSESASLFQALRERWADAREEYQMSRTVCDYEAARLRKAEAAELAVMRARHRAERQDAGIRRGRRPAGRPVAQAAAEWALKTELDERQVAEIAALKAAYKAQRAAISAEVPARPSAFRKFVDQLARLGDVMARRYLAIISKAGKEEKAAEIREKASRKAENDAIITAVKEVDLRQIIAAQSWRKVSAGRMGMGGRAIYTAETWTAPAGAAGRQRIEIIVDAAGRAGRYRGATESDRGDLIDLLRRDAVGMVTIDIEKARRMALEAILADAMAREAYIRVKAAGLAAAEAEIAKARRQDPPAVEEIAARIREELARRDGVAGHGSDQGPRPGEHHDLDRAESERSFSI